MRNRLALAASTLALAALCSGWLRADVVHLKNGQKIEGKIVSDTPASIQVDTKFGKVTIERAQIDRIESKRLPKDELAYRVELAGKDPNKLWEAAEYAEQNRLKEERQAIIEQIVAIDKNFAKAQEALGKVPYEGNWYTPEELEKEKAAFAMRMEQEGKVFLNGRWVPADAAKREQGLELYKGQWLSWADIYRLKSEELMPTLLGVELATRESEHFQVRSGLDEAFVTEMLGLLEQGYAHFESVFQPNKIQANIMSFYPIAVYVLPDPSVVTKFVEPGGYMDQMYNPPKNINERYADATTFPIFFPHPLIVTSLGRHNKGSSDWRTSLLGYIFHWEGNLLVRRFRQGGPVPGWIESGVATYYEGMLNGFQTLSLVDYVGYEHVKKWEAGFETFPEWYKKMADPATRASMPSLESFAGKPDEELTSRELVKGYFLVYWLMEAHPAEFVEYVRTAYKEGKVFGQRGEKMPEDEAFRGAFNKSHDEIDAEFEAWAANLAPRPPA